MGKLGVDVYEEGESIIFLIKDNGWGIKKEDLPRVKEKFLKEGIQNLKMV